MNELEILKFEEGFRTEPYYCTEGYPTIGIGTRIGPKNADLKLYEFSVSENVASAMLNDDLSSIRNQLIKNNWYVRLNESRQIIIKSMCYQLGFSGIMKFKKMIAALEVGDFEEAATQALDSKWARQTPQRANRHADVIRCGDIDSVYEGLI